MIKKEIIKLGDISTERPENYSKSELKELAKQHAKEIAVLQEMFYANGSKSMLIVFQGMDTSGKDGSTREAFKYCSPNGVHSFSFKKPTDLEMNHDFLWRVHKVTPPKGKIHVFNRSHYEDILIQYVHQWIDDDKREQRMRAINDFERLLVEDNDTIILKFYLHISYEKQEEKLTERMQEEDKFWKYNPGDWEERKHWNDYRKAYEYAINQSAYDWIIIPADSRPYRNYLVSKYIAEALQDLHMSWPPLIQ